MPLLTGKSSDFLKVAAAAAGRGDLETVRAVRARRPAWIRRAGSHGRTMLWEAATGGGWPPLVFQFRGDRGGSVRRVWALLDLGGDVDARNYKGRTALPCAAREGFDRIVDLLLGARRLRGRHRRQGDTPLRAAWRSRVKDRKGLPPPPAGSATCARD